MRCAEIPFVHTQLVLRQHAQRDDDCSGWSGFLVRCWLFSRIDRTALPRSSRHVQRNEHLQVSDSGGFCTRSQHPDVALSHGRVDL